MSEKESFWKWFRGSLSIGLFILLAGLAAMCLTFGVAMVALGDFGGFVFFACLAALFWLGAAYVYWRKQVKA